MVLLSKRSNHLIQKFMSSFGLVAKLLKTSQLLTMRTMSTLSMRMSWSAECAGLTNGLITILRLINILPQRLMKLQKSLKLKVTTITGGRLRSEDPHPNPHPVTCIRYTQQMRQDGEYS